MRTVTREIEVYNITLTTDIFDDDPDETVAERMIGFLKCAFKSDKPAVIARRMGWLDWELSQIVEDGVRGCRFEIKTTASGYDKDDALDYVERRDDIDPYEFFDMKCEFDYYDYVEEEPDY